VFPTRGFGWFRNQPALASAFLSFCLVAVGGLVAILPPGTLSIGRTDRGASGGWMGSSGARTSTAPAEAPVPRPSTPEPAETPAAEPGPWVEQPPSPPSARGLSLVYRYRTLPPGGESRYEWIVQVRGAHAVLEGVDMVSWRMEPAAKNGGDFVSRNRAAEGFPLFGDGPGGWFGVSATIRYQDGSEETLSRRIELSE
jgi:hypothetical protein